MYFDLTTGEQSMNSLTYTDFQALHMGTIKTFISRLNDYRARIVKKQEQAYQEAESKSKNKTPRTPSRRGK